MCNLLNWETYRIISSFCLTQKLDSVSDLVTDWFSNPSWARFIHIHSSICSRIHASQKNPLRVCHVGSTGVTLKSVVPQKGNLRKSIQPPLSLPISCHSSHQPCKVGPWGFDINPNTPFTRLKSLLNMDNLASSILPIL